MRAAPLCGLLNVMHSRCCGLQTTNNKSPDMILHQKDAQRNAFDCGVWTLYTLYHRCQWWPLPCSYCVLKQLVPLLPVYACLYRLWSGTACRPCRPDHWPMQTNCQSLLGKGLNGCNARRFHHDGPARSKRCETYPVPHPPSTLTWYPGAWAYFVIVFVFVQWAHFEIVILMCLLRGALCIHRYLLTLYSYLFNGLVLCL